MTSSDKHHNLFAHAQLQNSVKEALNTKKELTQTPNETNWFDESLAGCLFMQTKYLCVLIHI